MNDGEIAMLFGFIATWYVDAAKGKGVWETISSWAVSAGCLFIAALHVFKVFSGK